MKSDPQPAGEWKTQPAWADPWLRAQAERQQPYRGPAAEGALTRRDCVILGARTFALGVIIPCACAFMIACAGNGNKRLPGFLPQELTLLYVVLPPVALLGAVAGFQYYRMFTGPRAALEENSNPLRSGLGCFLWIIVGLFFHVLALTLFFVLRARRSTIARMEPGWGVTILFAILTGLFAMFGSIGARHVSDSVGTQAVAALLSIGASDGFLMNRIITLRNIHHLAVPETNKFQFSLATMLMLVWGLGAWITGLVVLARG